MPGAPITCNNGAGLVLRGQGKFPQRSSVYAEAEVWQKGNRSSGRALHYEKTSHVKHLGFSSRNSENLLKES